MNTKTLLFAIWGMALLGCNDDMPPDTSDQGGGTGETAQSLCIKYGGASNVAKVVETNVIANSIAADCRINGFFTLLSDEAFHRLNDCLVQQVQELFGCEGVTYTNAQSRDGLACRSMLEAHAGLGISDGDFDALIEDVVKGLAAAGVEDEDIGAAAPALLGMREDIVGKDGDTTNAKAMCNIGGAGGGN